MVGKRFIHSLCTSSVSLLALAPRSRFAPRHFEHFDCSSAASIARNIAEAYLTFFYLCVDDIDPEEWHFRLTLIQLHDCVSKLKIFRDFDPDDKTLPDLEQQAAERREHLASLPRFRALSEKEQSHWLKGERAIFLNQNQILERMNVKVNHFRGMYRFLSSHVHTLPLAFYRMGERDQGRGVESDTEKAYIAVALEFAEETGRKATIEMQALFPEIPGETSTDSDHADLTPMSERSRSGASCEPARAIILMLTGIASPCHHRCTTVPGTRRIAPIALPTLNRKGTGLGS